MIDDAYKQRLLAAIVERMQLNGCSGTAALAEPFGADPALAVRFQRADGHAKTVEMGESMATSRSPDALSGIACRLMLDYFEKLDSGWFEEDALRHPT